MKPIGLYLHTPFCNGKCPYCDFYSVSGTEAERDAYAEALIRAIRDWGEREAHRPIDTIYFGGGTPTLLGERLARILDAAGASFTLSADAEITVETNPTADQHQLLKHLHRAGFNRLSIGMQSANETELRFLGRKHGVAEVIHTVSDARDAGFDNLSLDLMLALEGQTTESLAHSVSFCKELGADHVSAYLLKIEDGTPFAARRAEMHLPDEEQERTLYLTACALLERAGYLQYEISNFAQKGRESRHNLKYWNDAEYLGLGPAAHSFLNGKRFFYPRDLSAFLAGQPPISDGSGGDEEEYCLMRLRLTEGLTDAGYIQRFGHPIPAALRKRAERLVSLGLIRTETHRICLTREGFLVSNAILAEIIS